MVWPTDSGADVECITPEEEDSMIIRKSADEIAKMRKSGRILAGAICRVLDTVAPGRTTFDLDRVAEQYIAEQGSDTVVQGVSGRVLDAVPGDDLRVVEP